MGRTVIAPRRPTRIISLVPSQTELLFDLGLEAEIVGRTKFCIHPAAKVAQKQSVGGTKQFRFEVIDRLQPDLIIGNKEENYQEGIERLAAKYPVWMSDITTLADALDMIRRVGRLVDREERAERLAAEIDMKFAQLPVLSRPYRVGYFIWQKPFMVAGGQTFIHDMLTRCGLVNVFAAGEYGRYPELTAEQIHAANLDAILLSSEPFPFAEKHRQAFQEQFASTARSHFGFAVYLVNGEMFSWYGSRLLLAADYLHKFIDLLT
ncbi:MAG: ABC transporter substrate-binding protein [Chloroflexi bacterium]|nr:ABC transporter substrate-binding protein [Ardenticatenaceae bacterium]MBL1130934.1 cobalamin-binding protein [Chloroflexota bacterium]NOG37030.1 ABC transporter substrate-binding protein [Chloroflexota bacterium]